METVPPLRLQAKGKQGRPFNLSGSPPAIANQSAIHHLKMSKFPNRTMQILGTTRKKRQTMTTTTTTIGLHLNQARRNRRSQKATPGACQKRLEEQVDQSDPVKVGKALLPSWKKI